MKPLVQRTVFQRGLTDTFAAAPALSEALPDRPPLPPALHDWLSRLQLLSGVPQHYLVPDEAMLPPESIRFFYLDPNWTAALVDGAYSIGRNLAGDAPSPILTLDEVTQPAVRQRLATEAAATRATALGDAAPATSLRTVTGFLLRSALVADYPGLGVYAYAEPQPGPDAQPLTVLRFERLAAQSDVMLCLVDGDAQRVEVHEAPEQLHYGLDAYDADGAAVRASKNIYPSTITPAAGPVAGTAHRTVALDTSAPPRPVDVSACFRAAAPRTLRVAQLADTIAQATGRPALNAAELAFQLVEGVGLVSYIKH